MKIMVIEPGSSSAAYGMGLDFVESIKKYCGLQVIPFDIDELWKTKSIKEIERVAIDLIRREALDFLFVALDSRVIFSAKFLSSLNGKVFKICYIGDDEHYDAIFYNSYCRNFDLILCSNYFPVLKYKNMGLNGRFWPSVFSLDEFPSKSDVKKDIDVLFIGNLNNKVGRAQYIERLISEGIKIEIYGSGSKNGIVSRAEMYQLFQRAKVNLNFTGVSADNPFDYLTRTSISKKQIKGRCQEIALSGGFVLSEWAFGLDKVFASNEEIVTFRCPEEMLTKVRYYLENSEQREAIACRGHERALENYTADKSWLAFENFIKELSPNESLQFSHAIEDKTFLKFFNAQCLFRTASFLMRGKLISAYNELLLIKYRHGLWLHILFHLISTSLSNFLYKFRLLRNLVRWFKKIK